MLPFLRLSDVPVAQKRVFVRVDFNVPLSADGQIAEDTRIRAALPGIRHCLEQGAALMLTSHLGRPTEGQFDAALSLAPVAQRLAQLLERPVPLVQGWAEAGWQPEKAGVAAGQVVLLENCRFVPGEKKNDAALAQRLASLCDVYVNDAFGTAHRAEATTHGMAQYAPVACAGPLLAAELDALGRALTAPKRPLVAIVAGSKVSTKLTILESLANKVDQLIVGGGIANTFMAAQGLPVGQSLCEPALVGQARLIIEKMQARGASVPIPTDVVVGSEFAPTAQATAKAVADVAPTDMIFDIGPNTAAHLAGLLQGAGTIVWNGPVGVFEFDQFGQGTQAVAHAIAGSSAFSIAGGGDTLAAIAKYGIASQVDYISTGGGAFLEFLEGKTLPAVDILQKRAAS